MESQQPSVFSHLSESGAFLAPASHEQTRLWYLWQENTADTSYNMAYKLCVNGKLNLEAVEQALVSLQERHEVLRTSFVIEQGNVKQLVHPKGEIHLEYFSLDGQVLDDQLLDGKVQSASTNTASKLVEDIAGAPFDLSSLPLMRCRLIRFGPEESWLVFAMHHIIGDGWSHAVLTRDFCAYYNRALSHGDDDAQLPELEMQYSDFAEWQKASATDQKLKDDRERWVEKINDVPELRLPNCHEEGREDSLGVERFTLDISQVSALKVVVREQNLTISALYLSAFQQTLATISNQKEFLMGMVVANRELAELDNLIGFFANTLAVDARINSSGALIEHARSAQSQLIDVQQYRGLPFHEVIDALRQLTGNFAKVNINALFVLQNSPFQAIELNNCTAQVEKVRVGKAKFPFTLFVTEETDETIFEVEYSTQCHSRTSVLLFQKLFLNHLNCLLAKAPSEKLASVASIHGIDNPEFTKYSVIERIWQVALAHPFKKALVEGDDSWTYGQITNAADNLANHLIKQGYKAGDVIATRLARSHSLYITMLGILRAGMIWAPIDADAPEDYAKRICEVCHPATVLSDISHLNDCFIESNDGHNPGDFPKPDDIAIVFHTSGSTGEPKGVKTQHKGIANVSCWIADELKLDANSVGVWKTTVTFDAVCRELFPMLVAKGQLVIGPQHSERDMSLLQHVMNQNRVSVLHCVPSQLDILINEISEDSHLKYIMAGGEPLNSALANKVLAYGIELYNVYGPTEGTVDVTYHKVTAPVPQIIPIGKPIPNTAIYITQQQIAVEKGCIGEIFIHGSQVAAGYFNEKVTDSGFKSLENVGAGYFTGDIGYISEGGEIYYRSRGDRQVKLNGVRIELSAIEHAFKHDNLVNDVHVVSDKGNELVAFITPNIITPSITAPNIDAQFTAEENKEASWNDVFDFSYDEIDYSLHPSENTLGWNCSATGLPIPPEEVLSACQQAADKVTRWRPKRILELGCGMGTLSFRLLPAADRFVGVDFSQPAIDYIQHHLGENVDCDASFVVSDIHQFTNDDNETFDAIVINSVIQYLSSERELVALLNKVSTWLEKDGFIFIGDVRDARLDQAFHLWKIMSKVSHADTGSQVLLNAKLSELNDAELRVAPQFFEDWVTEQEFAFPLIEHKCAQGHNELTKFRFDVTLTRQALPKQVQCDFQFKSEINPLVAGELAVLDACTIARNNSVDVERIYNKPLSCSVDAQAAFNSTHITDCRAFVLVDNTTGHCCHVNASTPLALHEICEISAEIHSVGNDEHFESRVKDSGVQIEVSRWQHFLASRDDILNAVKSCLPRNSLPTSVIQVPYFPLSRNGKRDNKTLSRIAEQLSKTDHTSEKPLPGSIEERIAGIFAELVGSSFLLDDNFFFKGGHSLLAAQVRNRIQKVLSCRLALNSIFEYPTPRALGKILRESLDKNDNENAINKRPDNESITLSHAQKRLWFIESLGTGTTIYNIAHAIRIVGQLDLEILDSCISTLITRHQTLRSVFYDVVGTPHVKLLPHRSIGHLDVWPFDNEASILHRLNQAQQTPFNLSQGPLYRFIYAPISTEKGVLCFICHHIISDGWSMMVALREISELYNAHFESREPVLPSVEIDYFDLAYKEQQDAEKGLFDEGLEKWRDILLDAPGNISLPYDNQMPKTRNWQGNKVIFSIPEHVSEKVSRYAEQSGYTGNMVYLAAYNILLSMLSGQKDIVIGTVSANRTSFEHEHVMGMMVNPLPIRISTDYENSFNQLCEHVRSVFVEAFALQEVPFEKLIEALDVDRNSNYQAVFQVLFAMQNVTKQPFQLSNTQIERIKLPPNGAMFDLSLEITENNGVFSGELEYSSELFLEETVASYANRYIEILQRCLNSTDETIENTALKADASISTLLSWGRGDTVDVEALTIAGLFAQQCDKTPDKIAVDFDEKCFTYGDLKKDVVLLASELNRLGCRQGDTVALYLARDVDVVVGYLAAHWIGAAPCYIDPQYPSARVSTMLMAASVNCVVTNSTLKSHISADEYVVLERSKLPVGDNADRLLAPRCQPNDIAFIAFTSGTTGTPKLVPVSHQAVCARLEANTMLFGHFGTNDKLAHCYSFNYDGGLLSLFWPITRGIEVVFIDLKLLGDANGLTQVIQDSQITIFDSIPTILEDLYHAKYRSRLDTLRLVLTGGDACSTELVRKHFSHCDAIIANQYGPCEAVINATTAIYHKNAIPNKVTIGKPIPGTDVVIVRENEQLAAFGAEGEIWVGGDYLAEGYLNDKEATDSKFTWADFGLGINRYYKSGDRGRWLANGNIEFLGRVDRQIQKNGMRLELDEIESVLASHPQVKLCRIPQIEQNTSQINAFVVPEIDNEFTDAVSMQWDKAFDAVYADANGLERDFTGWTETATGQLIPESEMACWLEDTISVLKPFADRSVLEIGAGLGLIALNLSECASRYVATDLSPEAIEALASKKGHRKSLEVHPLSWSEVLVQFADESFDLIIINSVIQYLSSFDELERLLGGLKNLLSNDGVLYLGDIKNYDYRRDFYRDTLAKRFNHAISAEAEQKLLFEMEQNDDELYVSLAGMQHIVNRHFDEKPLYLRHKPTAFTNELITYRYDAIIGPRSKATHAAKSIDWHTGMLSSITADELDISTLPLEIRGLPYTLPDGQGIARRSQFLEDIIKVSADHDLGISISPIGGNGLCNVVINNGDAAPIQCADIYVNNDGEFANLPKFGHAARMLSEVLNRYVEERLPQHMLPSSILVLNHLPTKHGGKIDEKLLTSLCSHQSQAEGIDDTHDIRAALVKDIWCRMLEVPNVELHDDFFTLGGHSLLAIRFVAAIKRELHIDLAPLKVFELRRFDQILRAIFSANVAESMTSEEETDKAHRLFNQVQQINVERCNQYPSSNNFITLDLVSQKPLSIAKLQSSLLELCQLHPLLQANEDTNNQRINCAFQTCDVETQYETQIQQACSEHAPLMSVLVLTTKGKASRLAMVFSAIAFDGKSIEVLWQDLLSIYKSSTEQVRPNDLLRAFEKEVRETTIKRLNQPTTLGGTERKQQCLVLSRIIEEPIVAKLEQSAAELNVTLPAWLLGRFAWCYSDIFHQREFSVECSVDNRAQLPATWARVVGPLSHDVPLHFSNVEYVEDFQIEAAERIANLMSGEFIAEEGTQAVMSFSYRLRSSGAMNLRDEGIAVKSSVGPLWNNMKLAVNRNKQSMVFTLRYDKTVISLEEAELLMDRFTAFEEV